MATTIQVSLGDVLVYSPPLNSQLLAPHLFGIVAAAFLMAYTLGEIVKFATRAAEESTFDRTIVGILAVLTTVTFALRLRNVQEVYIDNFGQISSLIATIHMSEALSVLFNMITNTTAQVFFAHRTFALCNRNKLLGLLLALWVSTVLGLSLYLAAKEIQYAARGSFLLLTQKIRVIAPVSLGLSALLDIFICACLVYRLAQERVEFKTSADGVLMKLIRLSLTTSAFTAFLATSIAVLIIVGSPTCNAWSELPIMVITQSYALSTCYTINSKASLRQHFHGNRLTEAQSSFPTFSFFLRGQKTETSYEGSKKTIGEPVELTRSTKVEVS